MCVRVCESYPWCSRVWKERISFKISVFWVSHFQPTNPFRAITTKCWWLFNETLNINTGIAQSPLGWGVSLPFTVQFSVSTVMVLWRYQIATHRGLEVRTILHRKKESRPFFPWLRWLIRGTSIAFKLGTLEMLLEFDARTKTYL